MHSVTITFEKQNKTETFHRNFSFDNKHLLYKFCGRRKIVISLYYRPSLVQTKHSKIAKPLITVQLQ